MPTRVLSYLQRAEPVGCSLCLLQGGCRCTSAVDIYSLGVVLWVRRLVCSSHREGCLFVWMVALWQARNEGCCQQGCKLGHGVLRCTCGHPSSCVLALFCRRL